MLCLPILLLGIFSLASARLQVHDSSFVPDHVLRISVNYASAACREKPVTLVNGTSPGPKIVLFEDETTWIRVYNDMDNQNATIHWHGLSQSVSPFSDGTPQAAQWPIPPNHFFDYEIHPSAGEAGTYLYHSHVGFQGVSAAGPLIVRSKEPSSYDTYPEHMVFLSEWFNQTDVEIEDEELVPHFTFSGETEAILVNGKSYPAYNASYSGDPISNSTVNDEPLQCSPEVFDVEPDTTYRFRGIGGLAIRTVSIKFENHPQLSVIGVDGGYTQPAITDRIQITPGQRFEWLLHTKARGSIEKSQYWIQLETRYANVNVTGYAILRYKDAGLKEDPLPRSPPSTAPINITDNVQTWLEGVLQPVHPNGFPLRSEVSRTVYLTSEQRIINGYAHWTVNNYTWYENAMNSTTNEPYLVQIYQNGEAAIPSIDSNGYNSSMNVYGAKRGEVIDIVLQNTPRGTYGGFDLHPWHIHGGHVWDLGSGNGTYNAEVNDKRFASYTPIKRDTLPLYKYTDDQGFEYPPYSIQGWRAFRLKVDTPGVWMVHCHILQHMIIGMQTVWIMGNATEITQHHEPFVQGYLDYGGSAYGNSSYDPLVYHRY